MQGHVQDIRLTKERRLTHRERTHVVCVCVWGGGLGELVPKQSSKGRNLLGD